MLNRDEPDTIEWTLINLVKNIDQLKDQTGKDSIPQTGKDSLPEVKPFKLSKIEVKPTFNETVFFANKRKEKKAKEEKAFDTLNIPTFKADNNNESMESKRQRLLRQARDMK